LTPSQVLAVDRALAAVGDFGEVRLVKVKGKVRFIQQLESNDLLRVCEVQE
jgi:monomeric isocitrate dehydrogenase